MAVPVCLLMIGPGIGLGYVLGQCYMNTSIYVLLGKACFLVLIKDTRKNMAYFIPENIVILGYDNIYLLTLGRHSLHIESIHGREQRLEHYRKIETEQRSATFTLSFVHMICGTITYLSSLFTEQKQRQTYL